jgi:hypothetical protein
MPYFKNDNVNTLFIHIPKTGGTSLEMYFSNKYNIPLNTFSLFDFLDEQTQKNNNIDINSSLQHITYQTIIKYKDFFNINFNNINIITIVRNPYERMISDLFFFQKINKTTSKEEVFDIIKKHLLQNPDNHCLPQYLFITNDDNKLLSNIKILHTETLTKDMHNLGFHNFQNRDLKNQVNVDYYNYLNNDSIKLINDFYDYDFKFFNYEKKNVL